MPDPTSPAAPTPSTPPAPPLLTRAQAREADRRAVEQLGLPGIVLMENAGINAADIATGMLEARGGTRGHAAAVVCGGGNNGGDGYVVARHLYNAGRRVVVFSATDPARLSGDAGTNHAVCQRMGVPVLRIDDERSLAEHAPKLAEADVLVDALLGTGYEPGEPGESGGLRPHTAAVITAMNAAAEDGSGPLVLAVDLPSGLDADTGQPADPTVRADATAACLARKAGFVAERARDFLGEVFVIGTGTPPSLARAVAQGS